MGKSIIAIDIDDVLGSQNEAMRLFINDQYGLTHTPEDYDIEAEYWGYWETVWGVDDDEGEKRWRAFMDNGGIENMQRHPEMLDILCKLEKRYDLVVVTARQNEFADRTRAWLKQNFAYIFKDIHFVPVFHGERRKTKAMICEEIGAKFLIDDNFEHCALAAEAGLQTLLFGDFGWNRNKELKPGMTRVRDWPAVLEYFEREGKL